MKENNHAEHETVIYASDQATLDHCRAHYDLANLRRLYLHAIIIHQKYLAEECHRAIVKIEYGQY